MLATLINILPFPRRRVSFGACNSWTTPLAAETVTRQCGRKISRCVMTAGSPPTCIDTLPATLSRRSAEVGSSSCCKRASFDCACPTRLSGGGWVQQVGPFSAEPPCHTTQFPSRLLFWPLTTRGLLTTSQDWIVLAVARIAARGTKRLLGQQAKPAPTLMASLGPQSLRNAAVVRQTQLA